MKLQTVIRQFEQRISCHELCKHLWPRRLTLSRMHQIPNLLDTC